MPFCDVRVWRKYRPVGQERKHVWCSHNFCGVLTDACRGRRLKGENITRFRKGPSCLCWSRWWLRVPKPSSGGLRMCGLLLDVFLA